MTTKMNFSWWSTGASAWSSVTATYGLEEGEFLIVPRGVEHRPVAEDEVHVLLFEPATTLNTGNVVNELTIQELERL